MAQQITCPHQNFQYTHDSRKIFTRTTEGIGKRGRVSYFPGVLTPGNQKDLVSISFTIKRLGFNINHCILHLEIAEELREFFGYFPPWQRDEFLETLHQRAK